MNDENDEDIPQDLSTEALASEEQAIVTKVDNASEHADAKKAAALINDLQASNE